MTGAGWLPAPAEELFGPGATAAESYEVLTVDVPPAAWVPALRTARDELGCTYFDWLSAVDEPGAGFHVCAHVAALAPVRRLLLRTTVPHEAPELPTAVDVYAGAAWHERETHEMFGVRFEGHPGLEHLLLPETFEGHPLRKDFVLAARVAKAWPGAKEPGESEHGGPKRRQMLPPGVPDPNEWGPLKGQLPPAPARPARGAGRAAGERPARAAGDRPVRRARTAAEGSASQTDAGEAAGAGEAAPRAGAADAPAAAPAAARPRRMRSASQGSVSQSASRAGDTFEEQGAPARQRAAAEGTLPGSPAAGEPGAETARTGQPAQAAAEAGRGGQAAGQAGQAGERAQAAAEGPAAEASLAHEPTAQRPAAHEPAAGETAAHEPAAGETAAHEPAAPAERAPSAPPTARPRRARSASEGSASQRAGADAPGGPAPSRAPRSSDAPWHHARPAFDEPGKPAGPGHPEPEPEPERKREDGHHGTGTPGTPDRTPDTPDRTPDSEQTDSAHTDSEQTDSERTPGSEPTEGGPQ
ncbi:NADH-quinone oxidoreductase subunit C [Streptomyces sp. NPDC003374]